MKKAFVTILALIVALAASACSLQIPDSTYQTEPTTETTETTKETTEKPTEEIKIDEEIVEKATKPNNPATDPTESSSSKKKTSELPTQGVTRPNTEVTVTTAPIGNFSSGDLEFVYDGAYVFLDDEIEDAFAIIGEDNSVTELSKDKIQYEYDDITLVTYQTDDAEKIERIKVTSSNLSTQKGAQIGMYATRLKNYYGEPNKKTDTLYAYYIKNKALVFYVQNNIVNSYEYILKHK